MWPWVSYLTCLNLGLLCCERAGLGQSHIKESFHVQCPGLFPLTSPKSLQAVVVSTQALGHQCQSWEPLTNFLGKNWISLSLWQMSVHSRLPPLSPDIWWPPVYKNSQTFVLPSINRAMFIPWNHEGTADGIVTKGRKLGKLVQTTEQIHSVLLTHCRRSWGCLPRLMIFPFLTCQLRPLEAQAASLERGWGWILPLASNPLEPLALGGPWECSPAAVLATQQSEKAPPKSWYS